MNSKGPEVVFQGVLVPKTTEEVRTNMVYGISTIGQAQFMKKCKLDPNAKVNESSVLASQLFKQVKSKNRTEFDIDIAGLAKVLTELEVHRHQRAIMEMIVDYKSSNPEIGTIMGEENNAPYNGIYNSQTNDTLFDLKDFPDTLILIINEFIFQMNDHKRPEMPRYKNIKK